MSTAVAETVSGGNGRQHEAAESYLSAGRGLRSWLTTLDHKRIGLMYLASILLFFFVGGMLAMGIRLELWTPAGELLDADMYNKFFTLHGAVMIFLFVIPGLPAALGNFVMPLMLGAKDVAFPRLNLFSYYLYCAGAVILLYTIISGGLDTGWTFYTPYSTTTDSSVVSAVSGAFVLGFSSILTGVNFIVTIHKMRAPGQGWYRLPLFVWSLYATAVMQILATPVLAITLLLLAVERTLHIGFFDPALGGDPVLFQHFFWFYSHPAVYIMIVPAFGIMSELITVHSRKNIFGYKAVALSSVAIAIIGFLVWGHHMFVSGQSEVASTLFSFLTFTVAVPTAIKIFSWVTTLYRGSISFTAPMLYALSFIFLFSIGGLTGLFLATLAIDVHLHDTYFVVGHFHYVMVGGNVIAFLGALHHWWPKMFGRKYNERLAAIAAALVFVGFNLTFFTQLVLGTRGMPRRYHSYLPEYTDLHQLSTVGSVILAVGLFLVGGYLLASLLKGERCSANPWGGVSLEWVASCPPSVHNFPGQPVVHGGPYQFEEIESSHAKVQA
ncbi:MAG: cytochrome c oxidase subunit I [Candidatus Schekmanbacteria bacterium]|nr:cytochrome c oxidase subunit I [Candidatus Schekmanbacteria bacterium]